MSALDKAAPSARVIVNDGNIVAEGANRVTRQRPHAHAEVLTIRQACRKLASN